MKKEKLCNIRKTSIGGQALIEGIMMRGPKKSAMAVRDPRGEMVLEKWENKKKKTSKLVKLPIIRGVFGFIDSMTSGYKCLMRSAEIAIEEETEKDKKGSGAGFGILMGIASVLGVVLAVLLFIMLPSFVYGWLERLLPFLPVKNEALNSLIKSVFEGVLKIGVLVGYMALVSLMKDIRRTFQYHGAEHKTIFCYEHGLALTVENVKKEGRFHPRCGTSFLILMLLVSMFISFFIDPLFILTVGAVPHVAIRALIKLLLLPITMGIGYEIIRFAGKHDNLFTRIVSAPGLWLQHITVLEPDEKMIECAIAAFVEVIPDEEKEAEINKINESAE